MIGIGIIGSGVGIRTHLKGFKQLEKKIDYFALYSPNLEKSEKIAKEHNINKVHSTFEDLCNDSKVDLIIVASPNNFHFKQVKYALNTGKNVLCEKPLCLNKIECEELISLKNKNKNFLVGINHQLRFNPYIKKIKEIIENKTLGEAFSVRIIQQGTAFSDKSFPWSWSFDRESGGGVRYAMGTHLVDLVFYLFERNISNALSNMHTVLDKRMKDASFVNVDTSSEFTSSITLDNGMNVYLSASATCFSGNKFIIEIFFPDGEINFDLENKLTIYSRDNNFPKKLKYVGNVREIEVKNQVSIFSGSFIYFAEKLIDAMENKSLDEVKDMATFEDGLKVLDLVNRMYTSYQQDELLITDKIKNLHKSY